MNYILYTYPSLPLLMGYNTRYVYGYYMVYATSKFLVHGVLQTLSQLVVHYFAKFLYLKIKLI